MYITASSPAATCAAHNRKLEMWKEPEMKKVSISQPMIIPLNIAGIAALKSGSFLKHSLRVRYIAEVAARVAAEPKIISRGSPADILARFESTQPSVSPGIAAGVKQASTLRTSATLNCTAAEVVPGSKRFCA